MTSPSGVTEMCEILELEEGHYSIKFVPKEMGVHTVSVKHKGMHISGECSYGKLLSKFSKFSSPNRICTFKLLHQFTY